MFNFGIIDVECPWANAPLPAFYARIELRDGWALLHRGTARSDGEFDSFWRVINSARSLNT